MADNYLERKMEEYRLNRHTPSHRAVSTRQTSPNELRTIFPHLRVLITGGANGIGRECVKAFREVDSMVMFCDIDTRKGNLTAQQLGARFYPVDVRSVQAIDGMMSDIFSRYADLDIVINNAGISGFTDTEDMTEDNWNNVIDTNLRPAYAIACRLANHRRNSGLKGGSIINISSTRAFQSEAHTIAYSASKGGLYAMTHSLMASLSPYGIIVNCIAPGWINVTGEAISEADKAQHPSGRVGTPEDVARLARFLAHPSNNFINGATIAIDGGMSHKMIYI